MRQALLNSLGALVALGFSSAVHAQVTIDNGIVGDGFWEVAVQSAGDSNYGRIDPVGPDGPSDVIYALAAYYDNGADGYDGSLQNGTINPATLTNPGEVTSSGTFPGPNGTINWTAVATIEPNSPLYTVNYQFTSDQPFGATRIINYFDEDVYGAGSDIVVVIGTPGQNDFQLLTVDANVDVGVALAADYSGAINMTWAGWAIAYCCGAPSAYSVAGEIGLPATTDPRFPNNDVYGNADVTTNFAWDFNPSATTASMTIALGGSPDATPTPPPAAPAPPVVPVDVPVNNPVALALLLLLMAVGGIVAVRRYG
jgi:hypothetical protein